MKDFIMENGGLIATVLLVLICANILLSAVYEILGKIKDKTDAEWDNKAYAALGKVIEYLLKVIDFLQGNVKHK